MSFIVDHSGRLFTAGKKKCSLKDLARNDDVTWKQPRASQYINP